MKPAHKDADDKLFERVSPAVKKLHAQSRKELREAERKRYHDDYRNSQSRTGHNR